MVMAASTLQTALTDGSLAGIIKSLPRDQVISNMAIAQQAIGVLGGGNPALDTMLKMLKSAVL